MAQPLPASVAEMLADADEPEGETAPPEKKVHRFRNRRPSCSDPHRVGVELLRRRAQPEVALHARRLDRPEHVRGRRRQGLARRLVLHRGQVARGREYGARDEEGPGRPLRGAGVSALAGLVTELGDARGKYGFSYEDIVMDWVGVASAIGIAHYGLDDLVGYRAGLVPEPAAVCCPYGGTGKDYTQEIYTADLKFAGLGRRMKFDPGIARYFMFSVSYSAKGYPYANPEIRDRQVGFELGINFVEILRALHVPPDQWWGKILYFAFDVLRIPYTQVGMYYGLNTGKWYGPGIGDQWLGK